MISTKVGRVLRRFDPTRRSPGHREGGLPFDADFDYGYDGTMRSVEQSMQRTGLDRFDILLMHDLDSFAHGDPLAYEKHYAQAIDGGFRALDALRAQGIVQMIGAGLNEAPACARLLRDTDVDCVLLAGRLTLLDQSAADEVLPLCRERRVALIAGGPFNSGILAAAPHGGSAYHYAAAPPSIVERARAWEALAASHGIPLQAAALQFALRVPGVSSVIPGPRSGDEMRGILDWYRTPVPPDFWSEALARGFVRPDLLPTQVDSRYAE